MAKRKLWVVGLFMDGEVETFGPFSKETAEKLFKQLNQNPPTGSTPFIRQLRDYPMEES